jgi:hypothetical protein
MLNELTDLVGRVLGRHILPRNGGTLERPGAPHYSLEPTCLIHGYFE